MDEQTAWNCDAPGSRPNTAQRWLQKGRGTRFLHGTWSLEDPPRRTLSRACFPDKCSTRAWTHPLGMPSKCLGSEITMSWTVPCLCVPTTAPSNPPQGCIRREGEGEGRGGLKGGRGRGVWLGPPLLPGSPYGPRQRLAEKF